MNPPSDSPLESIRNHPAQFEDRDEEDYRHLYREILKNRIYLMNAIAFDQSKVFENQEVLQFLHPDIMLVQMNQQLFQQTYPMYKAFTSNHLSLQDLINRLNRNIQPLSKTEQYSYLQAAAILKLNSFPNYEYFAPIEYAENLQIPIRCIDIPLEQLTEQIQTMIPSEYPSFDNHTLSEIISNLNSQPDSFINPSFQSISDSSNSNSEAERKFIAFQNHRCLHLINEILTYTALYPQQKIAVLIGTEFGFSIEQHLLDYFAACMKDQEQFHSFYPFLCSDFLIPQSNQLDNLPNPNPNNIPNLFEKLYFQGTIHISEESMQQVFQNIHALKPNVIMIELDPLRAEVLHQEACLTPAQYTDHLMKTITSSIVKNDNSKDNIGDLLQLIIQLLQAQTNTKTAREFLMAINLAEELQIPLYFIDRPCIDTEKKLSKITFPIENMINSKVDNTFNAENTPLTSENIEKFLKEFPDPLKYINRLQNPQEITTFLADVKNQSSELYEVLIQSRNEYMINRIYEYHLSHPNHKALIIMGIAHVREIMQQLQEKITSLSMHAQMCHLFMQP